MPSYLLVAEANLGLARYRQAEEQLTQSVEAHREARRENSALRKAAQKLSSNTTKISAPSESKRTKRDSSNPGSWNGDGAEGNNMTVEGVPAIKIWPFNEVSPAIAWFVCSVAMLLSWSVLVNNVLG